MLKIDFYESGQGETTIVTFPDNSIGVVDAYPSGSNSRPSITDLTVNKKLRFVCLSHPHRDHAEDIAQLLSQRSPDELWHTINLTDAFFYGEPRFNCYKSLLQENTEAHARKAIDSVVNIFSLAKENNICQKKINADFRTITFAGVDVMIVSPNAKELSKYEYKFHDKVNKNSAIPNPNYISAILVFQYGSSIFIHGGDAESAQWNNAYNEYKKRVNSQAILMKIPHHGARNALFSPAYSGKILPQHYIDLFQKDAYLVLFGKQGHPDIDVWEKLREKSENIFFLLNQYRMCATSTPPIVSAVPRPVSQTVQMLCNNHIHVELDREGKISINNGKACKECDSFHECFYQAKTKEMLRKKRKK